VTVLVKDLTDTGCAAFSLAGTGPRAGRFFQPLDRRKAVFDPLLEHARLDPLADADRFETFYDLLFLL